MSLLFNKAENLVVFIEAFQTFFVLISSIAYDSLLYYYQNC
jgi:hypothetical protein